MSPARLFTLLYAQFLVLNFAWPKEILWSDNSEAQLLQAMLLQSHKGKWFPKANKTAPYDDFSLKGGKLFKEGDIDSFTGWYSQFDDLGEPRMLCTFDDGKKSGFTYLWDENGTRRFQGEYLNNAKNGQFLEWNSNGIQISEKNYRSNKLSGEYKLWYDSGRIKMEAFFKKGKLINARGWYPDGNPCPYSKVANGRGVILRYESNFESNTLDNLKSPVEIDNLHAFPDLNLTQLGQANAP